MQTATPNLKIFPPKQDRSSRTQAAILKAAREMLEEGGEETLTIAGLAARVGMTTGAFYARFRNKDALLQALFEETLALNQEAMSSFFSNLHESDASLHEIISTFIPPAIELIRNSTALFQLFGSNHSGPVEENDRSMGLLEGAIVPVKELLQRHAQEIPGRDPELSAAMLVVLVQGMVGWSVHLRHSKNPLVPMQDSLLAAEIVAATLGYLGLNNNQTLVQTIHE